MYGKSAAGEDMTTALVIKADGSRPFKKEIPSQEATYGVIKETVASEQTDWFDCVRSGDLGFKDSFHAYVNDTGIIDGVPPNLMASILLGQFIAGDVIVFGSFSPTGEYDGNEHDVPNSVIDRMKLQWRLFEENRDVAEVRMEMKMSGYDCTSNDPAYFIKNVILDKCLDADASRA
jgi:hypothetical protein